jgi:hypothetical protein
MPAWPGVAPPVPDRLCVAADGTNAKEKVVDFCPSISIFFPDQIISCPGRGTVSQGDIEIM